MNEILIYILVLFTGMLLGIFFFGGLWWTTKKAVVSKYPAIWFLASIIVRFGVTLLVLLLISNNQWGRMLVCLLGFIISRYIVLKLTQILQVDKIAGKGGEQ